METRILQEGQQREGTDTEDSSDQLGDTHREGTIFNPAKKSGVACNIYEFPFQSMELYFIISQQKLISPATLSQPSYYASSQMHLISRPVRTGRYLIQILIHLIQRTVI